MDYKRRTQQIIQQLDANHLDWFMVNGLKNVRYLSGFTGSHGVLLISAEKQYIVTDGRYTEQVQQEVKDYKPIIQGKRKELETVRDALGSVSSKRVAFEAEHISYSKYQEMTEQIQAWEWVPTRNGVEELRACKDADEIEIIRRALKIAEDSRETVLKEIKEGMTERELAHRLEEEMWKRGAYDKSFDTIVLFGKRSSLPHGKPSDARLKKGDLILTDFGCVVDGYCSDITRMAFFGEPSEEIRKMYHLVNSARQSAEEKIKAGISTREADEFARKVIRNAGREEEFMHGLGHGVGLEIHESPRLSYISDVELKEGHVVTVEPGIYVAGVGGIRIENMMVVGKDKSEILNRSTTDLVVI